MVRVSRGGLTTRWWNTRWIPGPVLSPIADAFHATAVFFEGRLCRFSRGQGGHTRVGFSLRYAGMAVAAPIAGFVVYASY